MSKKILGIETSCDDTSVSIVRKDGWVEALSSLSKDSDHEAFGGIVPEIANRNHSLYLLPLVEDCMKKANCSWDLISGLAVVSRPGLIGSLIVGLVTTKALALAKNLPFIAVNHLEAHLLSPFLIDSTHRTNASPSFPYIGLIVSGGHTLICFAKEIGQYEILGNTKDDAAGEALDKFAKMMGLPFPGGAKIDKLSQKGNPLAFHFPRPLINSKNLDFSFSGLKTAAYRLLSSLKEKERLAEIENLSASFQEAILDVLIKKLDRSVELTGCKRVVITGGVSANSRLRKRGLSWAQTKKVSLFLPPFKYCTDNAAMVAFAGLQRLLKGESSPQNITPSATSYLKDFSSYRF